MFRPSECESEIFLYVCRVFFDIFRFRLVWIGPYVQQRQRSKKMCTFSASLFTPNESEKDQRINGKHQRKFSLLRSLPPSLNTVLRLFCISPLIMWQGQWAHTAITGGVGVQDVQVVRAPHLDDPVVSSDHQVLTVPAHDHTLKHTHTKHDENSVSWLKRTP